MNTFDESKLLSWLEYVIKQLLEAKAENDPIRPNER